VKRKLCLALFLTLGAFAQSVRAMTLREYELGWVRYYAQRDRVPAVLVEAIIVVESGGNPYAVSSKGAAGVMQLMPETAYEFRVSNRFLIQENIRAGVAYLASQIREFHGDLRLAIAAYYAGEKLIESKGLACSSPAVYDYVSKVAAVYRGLRAKRR
jgi:soluble lytic murein transglycosylase-like protein